MNKKEQLTLTSIYQELIRMKAFFIRKEVQNFLNTKPVVVNNESISSFIKNQIIDFDEIGDLSLEDKFNEWVKVEGERFVKKVRRDLSNIPFI